MRFLLVVLLVGFGALALAQSEAGLKRVHEYKISDVTFLKRYKDVLRLFKNIHQYSFYKDHIEISKSYYPDKNPTGYKSIEYVKEFFYYYRRGLLPLEAVFTVFNEDHLKEAIALFKLFYYAVDYDTFYKTAVWARNHVNHGLFLYSFSVAITHRTDTYEMVLPPIHEIYPYYFYNCEVIQKAQQLKQQFAAKVTGLEGGYTIPANHSDYYANVHHEQHLTYFTDDVGINSYYYYYNLYRPFWMNTEEYHINSYARGEEYYYLRQQLLARYYLERLSNGYGDIKFVDFANAIEAGYYPSLRYPNGLAFPERPNNVYLGVDSRSNKYYGAFDPHYAFSYHKVQDYRRRIRDVIDSKLALYEDGKFEKLVDSKGFDILGNIIEGNAHSINPHYYGNSQEFVRRLLGYSLRPRHVHKIIPSAAEHFETTLRDPVAWQWLKSIVSYFQDYKAQLLGYKYSDLLFESVKIEGLEIDRLVTYKDEWYADLSNAVYLSPEEFESDSFKIRARQWRLNYRPFSLRIVVDAAASVKSIVRIFIGPKFDELDHEIDFNEKRLGFVELDKFVYELKAGRNTIEHLFSDTYYASDRTSYKSLYQYVTGALDGSQSFTVDGSEVYYAFPKRYLLPKGTKGGKLYQLYVIINQFKPHAKESISKKYDYDYFNYPMVGLGVQYLDNYSLGFPLDKPIDEYVLKVPNARLEDITIYHDDAEHVKAWNVVH